MSKDILIVAHYAGGLDGTSNNRFEYLGHILALDNQVELITTDFSHSQKSFGRNMTDQPFKVTLVHENGYKKNIEIKRFISDIIWGKNVYDYLQKRKKPDVVYCAIPSLVAAWLVGKYCNHNNIRFIVDIQDLWPEAFQMVFNMPFFSNILYAPFRILANKSYYFADEIVAVSQTYVDRALKANKKVKQGHSVFIGTNLETFDKYASENPEKDKPSGEIWIGYCGTLGASYDITCVIDALAELKSRGIKNLKFIVMGSGPREKEFEKRAIEKDVDAIFTGKLPYPIMCGKLIACDIAVNPITHGAAQSIINKHADYAAAGLPVINTQECDEYRDLVNNYAMGFNCNNSESNDVANKLMKLINNPGLRIEMGNNSRRCAKEKFDRKNSYQEIFTLI